MSDATPRPGTRETPYPRLDAPQRTPQQVRIDYWRACLPEEVSWPHVGLGAALGAACLPFVGLGLALLVCLVTEPGALPFALFGGLGVALFAGAILIGYTALVAVIVLPLLCLAAKTMAVAVRPTPLACFSGGVLALVASLPFVVPAPFAALIAVAVALSLVTFVGQVGSGFAAMRYELSVSALWETRRPAAGGGVASRFTLRQIMGLMVVASVLLAILRGCGLLTPRVGALLAGWSVVQFGTLRLAIAIVDAQWRRLCKRPPLWLAPQRREPLRMAIADRRTLTGWRPKSAVPPNKAAAGVDAIRST